jgi:hypothetical protein
MKRIKHCDGFLACRTPKSVEESVKSFCSEHRKDVSEVINYLLRIFIEDLDGIRTRYVKGIKG